MLTEVPGARRRTPFTASVDVVDFMQNEDVFQVAFYTFLAGIPQDLNPAYRWVLFPAIVVRADLVRPVSRKHGLSSADARAWVDGQRMGLTFPSKFGWGGSIPGDPQSTPTVAPTVIDGPVELYYKPGFSWRYFFGGPVSFAINPERGYATMTGPEYSVVQDHTAFTYQGQLGEKGDVLFVSGGVTYLAEEDWWFMTPALGVPLELRMTLEMPSEWLGARWTLEVAELVIVPFAPSLSTVTPGPGLTGMRRRGRIVGRGHQESAIV